MGVQALIKKIQIIAFIIAGVIVAVVVYTSISKEEILEEDQQIMPPSEKIIFAPPDKLKDAIEGEAYSYSFCKPESARSGATCGGLAGATTDPYGGNPPYSFSHQFGVGFIPPGIAFELNGLLRGTPTLPGKYTFGVCVTDLYKEVCKTTSLTVKPKSEQAEEQIEEVSPSVKIESAKAVSTNCRKPLGGDLICDCAIEISGTATLSVTEGGDGVWSGAAICLNVLDEDPLISNSYTRAAVGITCPNWYEGGCGCVRTRNQPATEKWSTTWRLAGADLKKSRTFYAVAYNSLTQDPIAWDSVTLKCQP